MASAIAVQYSAFLLRRNASTLRNIRKLPVFAFADIANQNQTTITSNQSIVKCRRRAVVVAKAAGENPESPSSLSVVNSVKNAWGNSEDRVALAGLGFAAIAALWASINLIGAIDKLPVIPTIFEVVGIFFSSWFTYRYLLFKPDREELLSIIKSSISAILGQ